ncbi:MAG: 5,6-dimethylbenzimidazole synthase [Acidobacteriota bacterium]|nr:MAG: 5,6-dimethylbenzimidazole synthase [Acidobacteriota bacterium]
MNDDAPTAADLPTRPEFDSRFRRQLKGLFLWRRDVRRFRTEPLPTGLLDQMIGLAALSPSVGNSQPWRFVKVGDPERRARIRDNFVRSNAEALEDYAGEEAKLYASLKLSGLDDAPEQIGVFVDTATDLGHGLGRKSMPETLSYSVVAAVTTLWLAARAEGIGLGWVSILGPDEVARTLDVPASWKLVAYLCIGYPIEEHDDPELDRAGWQKRVDVATFILQR